MPYRALLPVEVDGLLTAGRSISATHVGMAAGKSMGNCVATGHAAGLAAAMSAEQGIMPRDVKVAEIQNALRRDGVDLTMGGTVQENVSSNRKARRTRLETLVSESARDMVWHPAVGENHPSAPLDLIFKPLVKRS